MIKVWTEDSSFISFQIWLVGDWVGKFWLALWQNLDEGNEGCTLIKDIIHEYEFLFSTRIDVQQYWFPLPVLVVINRLLPYSYNVVCTVLVFT